MSRLPLGAGADIEHDHPVPPGGEVAHGKLLDLLEGLPFGTPERERLGAEVPPDPIEPDHRETPEHPRDRLGPGLVYQEIELPIVRQERAGPGREAPMEGKVQAGRRCPAANSDHGRVSTSTAPDASTPSSWCSATRSGSASAPSTLGPSRFTRFISAK